MPLRLLVPLSLALIFIVGPAAGLPPALLLGPLPALALTARPGHADATRAAHYSGSRTAKAAAAPAKAAVAPAKKAAAASTAGPSASAASRAQASRPPRVIRPTPTHRPANPTPHAQSPKPSPPPGTAPPTPTPRATPTPHQSPTPTPVPTHTPTPTPRPIPTPTPTPTPTPGPPNFVRGAYGEDSSASGVDRIAAAGFSAVMTSVYREDLDPLQARGLRGVVWLGGWNNDTCSWKQDDAWVRAHVSAIAGHPAVLAYYLGDEPLYGACPGAPGLYRARTALVHALDPGRPTFTVIASWDELAGEEFPYGHWVGTVDILGFDVYVCSFRYAQCDFQQIDGAIAAAARYGVSRYWAVLQDFQDDYYRIPTPQEIATQFQHWDRSSMAGYFVFSWNYGVYSLDALPDNVAMLKRQNALHGGPS